MNTDRIWTVFDLDKVKKQWSLLTSDDLGFIADDRDRLIKKIQERYGSTEEEAQLELEDCEITTNDLDKIDSEQVKLLGLVEEYYNLNARDAREELEDLNKYK